MIDVLKTTTNLSRRSYLGCQAELCDMSSMLQASVHLWPWVLLLAMMVRSLGEDVHDIEALAAACPTWRCNVAA